jgi:hypothetical protein
MSFYGISYRNRYLQTWALVSRMSRWPLIGKVLAKAVRWTCHKVTGHEASKTEYGYGGGDFVDVWCRWCNEPGALHRAAALKKFDSLRNLVWGQTGCDISKGPWTPPEQTNAAVEKE